MGWGFVDEIADRPPLAPAGRQRRSLHWCWRPACRAATADRGVSLAGRAQQERPRSGDRAVQPAISTRRRAAATRTSPACRRRRPSRRPPPSGEARQGADRRARPAPQATDAQRHPGAAARGRCRRRHRIPPELGAAGRPPRLAAAGAAAAAAARRRTSRRSRARPMRRCRRRRSAASAGSRAAAAAAAAGRRCRRCRAPAPSQLPPAAVQSVQPAAVSAAPPRCRRRQVAGRGRRSPAAEIAADADDRRLARPAARRRGSHRGRAGSRLADSRRALQGSPAIVRVVAYAAAGAASAEQLNSYRAALDRAQMVAKALSRGRYPGEADPDRGGAVDADRADRADRRAAAAMTAAGSHADEATAQDRHRRARHGRRRHLAAAASARPSCWRCGPGGRIVVTAVSARDRRRDRGVDLSAVRWYEDAVAMAADPEIDVVVELIGGADGVALAAGRGRARRKKHVVTANKALMAAARHRACRAGRGGRASRSPSRRRSPAASRSSRPCARGLPAIASRASTASSTAPNYILTTMRESGREFAEVLAEAQKLGYAEADPSFDIDGVDAAHKLAILASVAFGRPVDLAGVYTEGIRHVSRARHRFRRGARLPHQAAGHRAADRARARAARPSLHGAARDADRRGRGRVQRRRRRGRFRRPRRARGARRRRATRPPRRSSPISSTSPPAATCRRSACRRRRSNACPARRWSAISGAYYIRLMVVDQPGVIADVAAALRDEQVSMESMIQRGRAPGEAVPVVLTTHDTVEAAMRRALDRDRQARHRARAAAHDPHRGFLIKDVREESMAEDSARWTATSRSRRCASPRSRRCRPRG